MNKPSPAIRCVSLASADGVEPAQEEGQGHQWIGAGSPADSHRASVAASSASTDIQAIKDRARKARNSLTAASVGAVSVGKDGEVLLESHRSMAASTTKVPLEVTTLPSQVGNQPAGRVSSTFMPSSSFDLQEIRLADHSEVVTIQDSSPLTPWSQQQPQHQHVRHPSSGSTQSTLSGASADINTMRDRSRQMAALALPGLVAIPDNSEELVVDQTPCLSSTGTQRMHTRNSSFGSSQHVLSTASVDIQAIKDRVRRGRNPPSHPGFVSQKDNEVVELEYRNQVHTSCQPFDTHLNGSTHSDINPNDHGRAERTSILSVGSFESSSTFSPFENRLVRGNSVPTLSPMTATSSDIEAMKQRARRGRFSVMQPGAASVREQYSPTGASESSKGSGDPRGRSYAGRSVNAVDLPDSDSVGVKPSLQPMPEGSDVGPNSHFVNPFIESERPNSGRIAQGTEQHLPFSTPENVGMRIIPLDHESDWEQERDAEKMTSSFDINKRFCRICFATLGIVIIAVTVAITSTMSKGDGNNASQSDPALAAACVGSVDNAAQSSRFRQLSEMLGLSEPNSARREAMCWLAYSDKAQVDQTNLPRMEQLFSLAVFYYSTQDEVSKQSTLVNWLNDSNECGWIGVSCEHEKVTKLTLSEKSLAGTLPPEISLLSSLSELVLDENGFTGTIPEKFYDLNNLTIIDIEKNSFEGSLSAGVGKLTSLSILSLGLNRYMTGVLPQELFELTKLEGLYMLGNNFEGFLPSSIGGMTNLRVFAGDGNSFNGTLPTEIGLCILLQELGLSSTDIASTIPTEFGMLQQLTALSLGDKLQGTIPTELGNCLSLEQLVLHTNSGLEGSIPAELGKLSSLQRLQLQFTMLTGTMPVEICALRDENLFLLGCDCLSASRVQCDNPECCTECY